MPIKKIVSILQQTQGDNVFSRRSFQIHDSLRELIGHAVEYDELVDMVYEVCSRELPKKGKPREFLQWIGTDFLRQKDDDTFVKWMRRQIDYELRLFHKEVQDNRTEGKQKLGVVIDDMRFLNEINLIKSYPRSFVFRLDCDTEEIARRLHERDGHAMASDELTHPSEQINTFDSSLFDAILDTTSLTERQVADVVLSYLNKRTVPARPNLEYNASELIPKYA